MARYSLRIKKSAVKDIEAIAIKSDRVRVINRIESLVHDPRPQGSIKLSGREQYRIRQGRYGILYRIENQELIVYVIKVADRKEIYKRV